MYLDLTPAEEQQLRGQLACEDMEAEEGYLIMLEWERNNE